MSNPVANKGWLYFLATWDAFCGYPPSFKFYKTAMLDHCILTLFQLYFALCISHNLLSGCSLGANQISQSSKSKCNASSHQYGLFAASPSRPATAAGFTLGLCCVQGLPQVLGLSVSAPESATDAHGCVNKNRGSPVSLCPSRGVFPKRDPRNIGHPNLLGAFLGYALPGRLWPAQARPL